LTTPADRIRAFLAARAKLTGPVDRGRIHGIAIDERGEQWLTVSDLTALLDEVDDLRAALTAVAESDANLLLPSVWEIVDRALTKHR
jgi:hypothetical protein